MMIGFMVSWFHGSVVSWFPGFVLCQCDDDRFHGFVVSWSRGFMVLLTTLGHRDEDRFRGFAVSWFCHPQKKKLSRFFSF